MRALFAAVIAVFGVALAAAQSDYRQADAQLNRTYQQLIRVLPPPRREQLRRAERAWVEFAARNRAALESAAAQVGPDKAKTAQFEEGELQDRERQLSIILNPDTGDEDAASKLREIDEQLNVVYQRCLGTVSADSQLKLREAQRAWITFQEENRVFGPAVAFEIIARRVEQLNDFYIRGSYDRAVAATFSPPSATASETAQKADRTVPDPFERAR
jgi:uncharacterized protein YecT (DUF1311 family)